MILQTGGSELGETSTRSCPSRAAMSNACWVGIMPRCCPSNEISLTAFAWILSFTFTSSVFFPIALPPFSNFLLNKLNEFRLLHKREIFPASPPRSHSLVLAFLVANDQHIRDLLEMCFPHLQIQLLVPEIPFRPDNSLFQRA